VIAIIAGIAGIAKISFPECKINYGNCGNYRDSGNFWSGDSAGPESTSPVGLNREP
jgi:hypothetical protein